MTACFLVHLYLHYPIMQNTMISPVQSFYMGESIHNKLIGFSGSVIDRLRAEAGTPDTLIGDMRLWGWLCQDVLPRRYPEVYADTKALSQLHRQIVLSRNMK